MNLASPLSSPGGTSKDFGFESMLLSLDESRSLASTLRCWSLADQEALLSVLRDTFGTWLLDWRIAAADDAHAFSLCIVEAPGTATVSDEKMPALIASVLFPAAPGQIASNGVAPTKPMALEIGKQAWADWFRRLDAVGSLVAGGADAGMPINAAESPGAPWSGQLTVDFTWPTAHWSLTLDTDRVGSILHRAGKVYSDIGETFSITQKPLVAVASALHPRPLKVQASLQDVSLTLGQLASLRLGDVVTLSHRLSEPARVSLQALAEESHASRPEPICAAWLGQAQDAMAIELLANPSPTIAP